MTGNWMGMDDPHITTPLERHQHLQAWLGRVGAFGSLAVTIVTPSDSLYLVPMSVEQLEIEVSQLPADELRRLQEVIALELQKREASPTSDISQFAGSLRGTVTYMPGWDEPEPLEMWEALRDAPS